MKDLAVQMGKRVRQKREALKLTRDELCNYVDISVDFLAQIERGEKGMSAETMKKFCNGLALSADYLLFGSEAQDNDVSALVDLLRNVDPAYLPLAQEHMQTFLKTIAVKHKDSR